MLLPAHMSNITFTSGTLYGGGIHAHNNIYFTSSGEVVLCNNLCFKIIWPPSIIVRILIPYGMTIFDCPKHRKLMENLTIKL